MRDLIDTMAAIDAANDSDPNLYDGTPLARYQGERASYWLTQLQVDPSPELQVAARAHHLRRWEVARADYPEGRSGYLRWRRENKAHQAVSVAEVLGPLGWSDTSIGRVQELLLRTRLKTDTDVQSLEDVACLVFVETQFDPMTQRREHDDMVNVVAKTLKKMSEPAIALAAAQPLSPASQQVLADAAARVASVEN